MMTGDDKFVLKEFIRGAAFTFSIVGVVIIGLTVFSPHAEIVDTYKERNDTL